MEIKRTKNGNELTVMVSGKIDTGTAASFEAGVKPYLEGVTSLILDLDGVDYVSSAGLRALLSLQKIMNKQGSMKLVNVSSLVSDVFEVTGFSDILQYEKGES